MKLNKKISKTLILTLIIVILSTLFIPVFAANDESDENEKNEDKLEITSEAALLIEPITGKILYAKNEREKKYPASTTKILTAILTIENCDLNEKVIVDYDSLAIVPSGYTTATLQVGEELSVEQLLEVLLVQSANDAANVLAKHVGGSIESFSTMMNSKASEIGCTDSHFVNPSGKHEEDHYSTAYDLALIMNYCMKNDTFKRLASLKSCIIPPTNKYEQRVYNNTNELLRVDTAQVKSNYYYPYAIAGKTGYTTQAKNCLVSVANKDGLELICVILGAGKLEGELSARFIEAKKIYEYGYNNYTIRKLREQGAIAKQIEVKDATQETKNLDLLISDEISVLINQADLNKEIEPEITLNENLSAPIEVGSVVGKIKYTVEGIDYTSDLLASHSVIKVNFFFYIIQFIFIIFVLFIIYKLIFGKPKRKRKNYRYNNRFNNRFN